MNIRLAKVTTGLFFVLLIGCVMAANYQVSNHTINLQVATDGTASITEKFYLFFADSNAKVDFRNKSTQLGLDLDKWIEFNPIFKPNVGSNNQVDKKIIYNEADQSYLEISYSIVDPIMAKGKETALMEEYSVKVTFFDHFYQSGLWVIPDNTSITIELPPGADTQGTVEPQATVGATGTRKTITWTGYESSNRLTLDYVLWKKLVPVIDMSAITTFFFKTPTGLSIIGILALVIAAIIWKRKTISAKIENFVENNSLLEEK